MCKSVYTASLKMNNSSSMNWSITETVLRVFLIFFNKIKYCYINASHEESNTVVYKNLLRRLQIIYNFSFRLSSVILKETRKSYESFESSNEEVILQKLNLRITPQLQNS